MKLPRHFHLVALLAVVAVVYHGVVAADFVNWDDTRFVTTNPLFHGGVLDYIAHAVGTIQFEAYQPVHLLSYLPDRLLWPDEPAGFHALSLAIFLGDVALVFALARRRASAAAAACATLVFALHPLVVEPVAWITARKDVLALLFVLLALAREDRAAPRRWIAVALYVLALATKSAMVCFPPILWLWLVYMTGMPWRPALRRALPFAVPAVVCGVAVLAIWHAHGMVAPTELLRPLDIPGSWGFYVAHVAAPFDLAPLYPEHLAPWLGYATLAACALALVLRRRLPRPARFVLLAFVCTLVPVSNVVPLLRYADRFTLLGLALAVPALALALDTRRHRRWQAVALVVAAAELAVTVPLVATWHDSRALWEHAARAQPDAFYVRMKYGETLRDAHDFDGAAREYEATIALDPQNVLGYASLFQDDARRAEHDSELPAGTTERWMTMLGGALAEPHHFAALWGDVAGTHCLACKDTLLRAGLVEWPQPDRALLADADDALRRGVPDEALIFLSKVAVHDARYDELRARATQARYR